MPIAPLILGAVLATAAPAEAKPTPYVMDFLETGRVVGYDYAYGFADPGSTSASTDHDTHGLTFVTNPKSAFLRVIVDSLNNHFPYPKETTIHRGDDLGTKIAFKATSLHSVSFPALSSSSQEIGRVRMRFNADAGGPQSLGSQPFTPSETEAMKADRKKAPWLVNAFHFKVDGVEDHMVTGISAFDIVNVGDLDGDGAPDFRTSGPIQITIPVSECGRYLALGDDPTVEHIFKICWLDDMHIPFLTFRGTINIAGWGPSDPFNPDGTVNVRITRGDVAMMSDTTCSMGGTISAG